MIWKYSLVSVFILLFITASDPHYGVDFKSREVPEEKEGDFEELSWRDTRAFDRFLEDHDHKVDDAFKISPYYKHMVRFWFLIYTQFSSNQVVIHDKNNMTIIYRVLDFSSLIEKEMSSNTIYLLQQKVSREKQDAIKQSLAQLVKNPFLLTPDAQIIYKTLIDAGVTLPTNEKERQAYFLSLHDNIRSQTGQKNFIRDGIIRSQPYQNFLTSYFKERGLPKELLAIPFLESSFNPKAHSKANALGVWQFMPLIASYFFPTRTGSYDFRSNVGVASVSAAFLMSENYKIMKSWDLAVTAYNSGTKHLLKTKREIGTFDANLQDIIEHSDSKHFGFASKNFYSEFLALAHTLAYREILFKGLHKNDRSDVDHTLRFYLAKCSLRLDRVLNASQLDDVKFHNHQLLDLNKMIPRGMVITTKAELPSSKFKELTDKQLLKIKPKNWINYLNQSCSTR